MPFPKRMRGDEGLPPAEGVERIARICALGLGPDELLEETCREIVTACGVDACYLVSYRERDGAADVRRFAGPGDWRDLRGMYRADPLWDAVLEGLRAHGIAAVDDLLALPPDDPVRVLHEPHSVRSLVLAPLRLGTGLVGLLALHRYGAPRAWGREDISVSRAVSRVLSASLERRRMEGRLRASEARYRFLAENALDLISLHDADGRYLYASPAAGRMLGYRPEEMIGCGSEAFLAPEDRERVADAMCRLLKDEVSGWTLQHRLRKKDGGLTEVETAFSRVPGRPPQVLRVARDLSERKAIESRLVQSHKLETIGMLAGGVAHEFNNLLMGITGTAEMLSLLLAGNEEAAGYLAMIERMGSRATELTQQLLAYAGQGRHRPELVPIHRMIRDDVLVLKTRFPPSVEVSLELAAGEPTVRGDVVQLKQVLVNLCLNAAEAMPEGGTLTIRTRLEEGADPGSAAPRLSGESGPERTIGVGDPRSRTWAVLEVSDTGCGMDDDTLARIFEPFFSTKFIGRGMGLAAVRGIVEGHGGVIRIASAPGRGTTVTVRLPAPDVVTEPAEEASGALSPCGTGTILVADDQDDVRSTVRAMLESFGYRVVEARDGREAVDVYAARKGEIDLVLLDMMMPGLTGEEAFAEIRRLAPSARAILASGYDERGRIAEVVGAGFLGFLQKPFRRSELGRKVEEALGEGPRRETNDGA